ncbi:GNAT family N-acetyltransferase [Lysinibacillus pakistanensis]|uniref:GNAT family N-acetyltransferase n=1 Tax=Lysinibacillus pakistanensis TaxID=759811 RepID=A0AAX3WV15_9BACI|nr:GNAT family N-acetyltransferase [Lysinibacillus pakistanensis]MDM5229832.1 GNAT family N-acetyltransferase [Lysinibacillus pakistanensis]QGG52661.1 GNAT family N-acetyltransferase [Lysinibacillus pakistanensis]WHY45433.1 GNAT family N-acetyltransferase [Lysinibacillus pakistanensis]WHY50441.1 GNAT family N-acetyltransferase [Lysinibacillus pakistanensis]
MAVVEIVIEQLKEEDHARYLEVLVESYSQYEKEYNNPEDWASYLSAIRASVGNPDAATILVAKQGDEILGGLQLFTDSEKAYGLPELSIHSTIVRLLGVHPKGRGLGIAKKLLQESFAFARARQDQALYLHSGDIMQVAINLYLSLGFVRDESKDFRKGDILVKGFRYDL